MLSVMGSWVSLQSRGLAMCQFTNILQIDKVLGCHLLSQWKVGIKIVLPCGAANRCLDLRAV